MVLLGVDKSLSDKSFIHDHGLPHELANKPEMNFWMIYKVFNDNVESGMDPEDVDENFYELCDTVRKFFPKKYWKCMDYNFVTYSDKEIFEASRYIYEYYDSASSPSISVSDSREKFYVVAVGEKIETILVMVSRCQFGNDAEINFINDNFAGLTRQQVGQALAYDVYKNMLLGFDVSINNVTIAISCLLTDPRHNILIITKDQLIGWAVNEKLMDNAILEKVDLRPFIMSIISNQ